jgi:hypothetical protein
MIMVFRDNAYIFSTTTRTRFVSWILRQFHSSVFSSLICPHDLRIFVFANMIYTGLFYLIIQNFRSLYRFFLIFNGPFSCIVVSSILRSTFIFFQVLLRFRLYFLHLGI